MRSRNCMELVEHQFGAGKNVCAGLDLKVKHIPIEFHGKRVAQTLYGFNCWLIEQTLDTVFGYKLNFAHYAALRGAGLQALKRTFGHLKRSAPEAVRILDCKDTDIGSTNDEYVEMAFNWLGADAVTVNPYFGGDALGPFLKQKDKGVIVLVKTSNPGSKEIQGILCEPATVIGLPDDKPVPVYQRVAAQLANSWNEHGNCMAVVGANFPEELSAVRRIIGRIPILNPAIGFQQEGVPIAEQVKQVVEAGGPRVILNSSRGVIRAADPRAAVLEIHNAVTQYRKAA